MRLLLASPQAFGDVYYARYRPEDVKARPMDVGVKTLNNDVQEAGRLEFLVEGAIMARFRSEHVLR